MKILLKGTCIKLTDTFWTYGKPDINLNLIKKLRHEIYMLKLENNHLKMKLEEVNSSWVHPNSCLHNEDLWEKIKT